MRLIIIIPALLFLISGCSYQQRFNRLIKKHPDLLGKADTTYIHDTISYNDTIVTIGDTVEIFNVDTFIDTEYQTIYVTKEKVKIITKPKVIIKEVKVPTKTKVLRYITKENNSYWLPNRKIIPICGVALGLFLLILSIFKLFKK